MPAGQASIRLTSPSVRSPLHRNGDGERVDSAVAQHNVKWGIQECRHRDIVEHQLVRGSGQAQARTRTRPSREAGRVALSAIVFARCQPSRCAARTPRSSSWAGTCAGCRRCAPPIRFTATTTASPRRRSRHRDHHGPAHTASGAVLIDPSSPTPMTPTSASSVTRNILARETVSHRCTDLSP